MSVTFPLRWPLAVLLLALAVGLSGEEPVEVRAGDRVLLIGDTLFEREGVAAALETRLYQRWAPRAFTVRNLSVSADRPDGISRASFDPLPAGMARLTEQLALVKPTVAILGYGMAASLDQLAWQSGDPTLNPDAARYGEGYPAARFKDDLGKLMDAITASNGGAAVRFVLVAPIAPEDLRTGRPTMPDPAAHRALLADYVAVLRDVAQARGARFVDAAALLPGGGLTDNGIHPTPAGLERWADAVASALGWSGGGERTWTAPALAALRATLQRKNDLFFHRWRPANQTYLFGFRKHEQGRNGAEIGVFDTMIAEAETAIAAQVAGQPAPALPIKPAIGPAQEAVPAPAFQTSPGVEVALWAQNPLLSKPVHLAWDARGRLWVSSTPLYPMIEPGAVASDRIYVLEDTDHDGKADKATVFTDQLLIPSGLAPVERADGKAQAYVGASTELLLLTDTDGDGKADQRRVVLSGFGTEDTHHTLHTLYWGVDGRLYFDQSVYIHSHLETPWGVVRLNSGGVCSYDPRSERVAVFIKGLWNPWGHKMDAEGQSFFTDGAGSSGVNWGFPGAVFGPSEGSRATMPGISPGSYPKFCGLELVASPAFPADWQGNAITCDFRAHRVVRMAITPVAGKAGYVTADQADPIRTPDAFFRPIDAKLGPDGALYLADWTNSVINHGEVDFRDPRRDKDHGRIWRVTSSGLPPLAWKPVAGRSVPELCDALVSANAWERDSARRVLASAFDDAADAALTAWTAKQGTPIATRAAAFVRRSAGRDAAALAGLDVGAADQRAISARWLGDQSQAPDRLARLAKLATDEAPRVRLEAMRALARIPTIAAFDAALAAIAKVPGDDAHANFAALVTLDTFGKRWVDALVAGTWDPAGREAATVRALQILPANVGAPAAAKLLATQPHVEQDPWPELAAHAGDQAAIARLFAVAAASKDAGAQARLLAACGEAAGRGVPAPADVGALAGLLASPDVEVRKGALRLAGKWRRLELIAPLRDAVLEPAVANEAVAALQAIGGADAVHALEGLIDAAKDGDARRSALAALAKVDGGAALTHAWPLLAKAASQDEALGIWRALWPGSGVIDTVLKAGLPGDLSPTALAAGLASARELGNRGNALAERFAAAQPRPADTGAPPATLAEWVERTRRGDAGRGERLYFAPGTACIQCHAIGGAGGKLGPDLTTIGTSAPLDYIIESVLQPAAKVKEGYHAVTFKLKDGSFVVGIPFAESERAWSVRTPAGEQAVAKADVVSKEVGGSLMPPGLTQALSAADQADLYAFLGALGKPGAWDASDGRTARQFRVSGDQAEAAPGKLPATSPLLFSLVDGRVTPAQWRGVLGALPPGDKAFAVARFQLAAAATVTITFDGGWRPWVDGIPMEENSHEVALQAGEHSITVGVTRKTLPKELRVKVSVGRFVAP
jgi:putative heme-binding domain-containing protein